MLEYWSLYTTHSASGIKMQLEVQVRRHVDSNKHRALQRETGDETGDRFLQRVQTVTAGAVVDVAAIRHCKLEGEHILYRFLSHTCACMTESI